MRKSRPSDLPPVGTTAVHRGLGPGKIVATAADPGEFNLFIGSTMVAFHAASGELEVVALKLLTLDSLGQLKQGEVTYSVNCVDTDKNSPWMSAPGITQTTPDLQDDATCRWTVRTTDEMVLVAALEADDDVLEYQRL